jgi:polar amino acid transport system substrate-binding protein
LVVPLDADGVRSLTDLRNKKVGIVAGTVAIAHKDHQVVRFKSREELFDRFRAERLEGAFMDADFAAWYLHAHPDLPLRLVEEYVPRERWNMAFAVRPGDSELLVEINRAAAQVAAAGGIRTIYAEHGLTLPPPFTNTARREVSHDAWKQIEQRGQLVASMDPANLPYSSATEDLPGFDVEILRALAHELGVKLRIDWIDVQRETAIGQLLEHECDLACGAAVDPDAVDDEQPLSEKVIYSRPYYGTGYMLVGRNDGPSASRLSDLKGEKSRRLGTEAGSVADYRLRQNGYLRRLFRNQLAVLKSLHDGHIDHAYLWANVGWTLHTTPEFDLRLEPGYVPQDRWNIAIAMRRGDDELKRRVDAAIETLIRREVVAGALKKYYVPYFRPFEDETKKGAGVIRRGVADRGLEPQAYRRRHSKKAYGELDRIRSAGRLIVGLDQNNLPFSTAHPKPAGLDYEIAAALGERLGVSLQVYWAYSSHDSYPSKLATKKYCDAILGVTPDDRFGNRVLYSKPYHVASYQFVVAVDGNSPTGLPQRSIDPLGVETGIAARGILGRDVKRYSSLEDVLRAVAVGETPAGYAASMRGHWLAEQQWPGKLKFLDAPNAADQFPMCVAVRKGDGDLKEAIDAALDELASSGGLARIFARWSIPYVSADNSIRPSP